MTRETALTDLHPPLGHYSHSVSIPAGSRILITAGQVAVHPDGSISDRLDEQCSEVWRSIATILARDGLSISDVAHVRGYIVDPNGVGVYGRAMAVALGPHRPASTLVTVAALASPTFLVEIEVTAFSS